MRGCFGQVIQRYLISLSPNYILVFLLLICCTTVVNKAESINGIIYLDRDKFLCLVENFDKYIEEQGEDLIIANLEKCPNPVVTVSDISKNTVAISPIIDNKSPEDQTQSIVSFNSEEIDCIIDKKVEILTSTPVNPIIDMSQTLESVCE